MFSEQMILVDDRSVRRRTKYMEKLTLILRTKEI